MKNAYRYAVYALNAIGLLLFLHSAYLFLSHNMTLMNPVGMLPTPGWSAGGMRMCLGAVPLLAVNHLLYRMHKHFVFYIPGILCFVLSAAYWVIILAM